MAIGLTLSSVETQPGGIWEVGKSGQRPDRDARRSKVCPVCRGEAPLGARLCPSCEHEFPQAPERLKSCADCGSLNPTGATSCQVCGNAFAPEFSLTLDDALRQGAIVRGMELDEEQVVAGERIAPVVREKVVSSGDETLVSIVKALPEESWGRLEAIFAEADSQ